MKAINLLLLSQYQHKQQAYYKLRNKLHGVHDDSNHFLQVMEFNGFSDEDIVKGFLASLYEKKKTRQAILESVLDSEVSKSIVLHVYKSIQGKKMLVGSVLCP
jgi:sulfur transfer protein SufE